MTPLSALLAEVKAHRRLSYPAMAAEIGVTKNSLIRYIHGDRPDTKQVNLIAAFLGLPPDEVMVLAGHMPAEASTVALSTIEREMLRLMAGLDETGQAMLFDLANVILGYYPSR